jgi:HEAT repeat protein
VPELAAALKDAEPKVRRRAAWALSLFGPEGKEAVPALLRALSDDNADVRGLAAVALGEIGPAARPACDRLVAALTDSVPAVRTQAAQALRRIGAGAVAALARALSGEQPTARQQAAQALGLLGPEAKEAVPQLTEAIKDAHVEVRLAALAALGAVGPAAKPAVPAVIDALQVKHLQTQLQAFAALLQIAGDDAEALGETLREVTLRTRWATPYLLPQFGPRARDAVKPLIQQLEDPDPNVRVTAAVALGNLGSPTAAEAVLPLTRSLKDPAPAVRVSAAAALAALNPLANRRTAALEALEQAVFQIEKVYAASLVRLEQLNGNSPYLNPAALTDPVLQGQYNYIVNTFIVVMNFYPGEGKCAKFLPIQRAAHQTLTKLGPEATPALVRGLNYVGRYRIGFT